VTEAVFSASLARIARHDLPSDLTLSEAVRQLTGGTASLIRSVEPIPTGLPGVIRVEDDPEAEADLTLVIYRNDPARTAAEIEERMHLGQRVALVDQHSPGRFDPALMDALLASTVYIGNLAACDTDLDAALALAMTPPRDGRAFRALLACRLIRLWAWDALVREEVLRRFGPALTPELLPKAVMHSRTRLGAYLLRLHRRGLRFRIGTIHFIENRVDGMTFTLKDQ
jgi:hypothetical protein